MALREPGATRERALAVAEDDGSCPGCGALLPATKGPRHAYLGASPACWALYQRLSGRLTARPDGLRTHRLLRDAYAAQHPGERQLRSVQSVAIHLMDLCLVLERGGTHHRREPATHGRAPRRRALDLHWLEPPRVLGVMTASDALRAEDDADVRAERVEAWAADVWDAWEEHHHTIRRWLDASAARRDAVG